VRLHAPSTTINACPYSLEITKFVIATIPQASGLIPAALRCRKMTSIYQLRFCIYLILVYFLHFVASPAIASLAFHRRVWIISLPRWRSLRYADSTDANKRRFAIKVIVEV
jgi:hypothetical protein